MIYVFYVFILLFFIVSMYSRYAMVWYAMVTDYGWYGNSLQFCSEAMANVEKLWQS